MSRHMNRIRLVPMIAAAALLLVALGCETTGTQRSAGAATSMATLEDMLEDGKTQINETISALNAVRRSAVAEPDAETEAETGTSMDSAGAFADYRTQLKRLEDMSAEISKRAQEMRTRTEAYYTAWQQELEKLSNEQLRERGEQRRQQVLAAFERINEASQDARDRFNPMLSDLQDIRIVLDNDLSPAGIRDLEDLMDEANADAAAVNRAIDEVITEIRNVRSMMGAG